MTAVIKNQSCVDAHPSDRCGPAPMHCKSSLLQDSPRDKAEAPLSWEWLHPGNTLI